MHPGLRTLDDGDYDVHREVKTWVRTTKFHCYLQLIARGQKANCGLPVYFRVQVADGGQETQLSGTEHRPLGQHNLALFDITSYGAKVKAWLTG